MAFYPSKVNRKPAPRSSPKPVIVKPIPQQTLDNIAARARASKTRDAAPPPARVAATDIQRMNRNFWTNHHKELNHDY